MAVIIPPSVRPLLLWLAATAVCAVILTLEGMTFVTLWRRPSRPWRLGLVTLALAALAVALAGRILGTYHDLANISICYTDGCEQLFPWVTNAVTVSAILGGPLIEVTCASVVAAIVVSAAESASRAGPIRGAWNRIERLVNLSLFVLITDAGVHWAVDGATAWAQTAYLLNPGAAGDGLGLLPFEFALAETVGGLIVLGLGASLLWFFSPESQPQIAQP
jgi:hypothetical protein